MNKLEQTLRKKIEFLEDRLALSLMMNYEAIAGTVVLPSREDIREDLRQEPEYRRKRDIVLAITERGVK